MSISSKCGPTGAAINKKNPPLPMLMMTRTLTRDNQFLSQDKSLVSSLEITKPSYQVVPLLVVVPSAPSVLLLRGMPAKRFTVKSTPNKTTSKAPKQDGYDADIEMD